MQAEIVVGRPHQHTENSGSSSKPPLWQAAIKSTKANSHYIAGRIETEMSVFNGDGKLLGVVSEVERLELGQGKPRWKTESKKQTGSPGMTIKADFGLQADPGSALDGYDEWHLRGKDQLDGSPVEIWEGISRENPKNKVIAYIDLKTELPRKTESTMPFTTPVGSILVNATLTYAWTADRVWLPSQIVMDQKGRLFFIKRHLHMIKDYKEWRPRLENNSVRGDADGQQQQQNGT